MDMVWVLERESLRVWSFVKGKWCFGGHYPLILAKEPNLPVFILLGRVKEIWNRLFEDGG